MRDERLRELERRLWKTGSSLDERRYFSELLRGEGVLPRVFEVETDLVVDDPLLAVEVEGSKPFLRAPGASLLREAVPDATPRVVLRQALVGTGRVVGRHVLQTCGPGQFAHIELELCGEATLAPLSFIDRTPPGELDRLWVARVEHHLRRAATASRLVGLHVELVRGRDHLVDSTDLAFAHAVRKALDQAFETLKRVVLEPWGRTPRGRAPLEREPWAIFDRYEIAAAEESNEPWRGPGLV